ncbi:MAG: hypothetical protein RBJ76_02690 [Stenomitos frigidus ULC029]
MILAVSAVSLRSWIAIVQRITKDDGELNLDRVHNQLNQGAIMDSGLDDQQSQQLLSLINGLEALIADTGQEGAEAVLDELYVLLTKIYDQFPELDTDEV